MGRVDPDSIPYGPGSSDYEYEKMMDEQFERMTFEALVRAFQRCPTTEDLQILCYHAGFAFKEVQRAVDSRCGNGSKEREVA